MSFVPAWYDEGGMRPTNAMSRLREILLWETMVESNNRRARPRPRKPPIRIRPITAQEEAQDKANKKVR